MTNNQFKPVEKTYIIQEQPVKQSNLSTVAKNKVVNHNKPYQSLNQVSYGPCIPFNQNCECSLAELQRQRLVLENQEIEERIQRARTIDQQNEELQRLRTAINNANQERDNRPNTTINDYNNLRNQCNELQQQVTELNNQLTQRNNQIQGLTQQVRNLTNQVNYVPPVPQPRQPRSIMFVPGRPEIENFKNEMLRIIERAAQNRPQQLTQTNTSQSLNSNPYPTPPSSPNFTAISSNSSSLISNSKNSSTTPNQSVSSPSEVSPANNSISNSPSSNSKSSSQSQTSLQSNSLVSDI